MSPSLILKILADMPRRVKAAFLMCFDFVVLCFAILLAFAVRFDPASLEQQFRILSEGILSYTRLHSAVFGIRTANCGGTDD